MAFSFDVFFWRLRGFLALAAASTGATIFSYSVNKCSTRSRSLSKGLARYSLPPDRRKNIAQKGVTPRWKKKVIQWFTKYWNDLGIF